MYIHRFTDSLIPWPTLRDESGPPTQVQAAPVRSVWGAAASQKNAVPSLGLPHFARLVWTAAAAAAAAAAWCLRVFSCICSLFVSSVDRYLLLCVLFRGFACCLLTSACIAHFFIAHCFVFMRFASQTYKQKQCAITEPSGSSVFVYGPAVLFNGIVFCFMRAWGDTPNEWSTAATLSQRSPTPRLSAHNITISKYNSQYDIQR